MRELEDLELNAIEVDVWDINYRPATITEKFSVCMTVKNEVYTIERMLKSTSQQLVPTDDLIVVDGGSTDGTLDILARFAEENAGMRWIGAPGTSPAEGRNIAGQMAKHDLQITTDAGCLLHIALFSNLIGPMQGRNGPDITAGIYLPFRQTPWSRHFIPNWNNIAYLKTRFLPSARCMAVRRGLLQQVGWFPTHLKQRWGEDTLFDLKARRMSKWWVINRRAKVYWRAPETKEEACELSRRYGMGTGEIGRSCPWSPDDRDPVLAARAAGYRIGCALRTGEMTLEEIGGISS